MPRLWIQVAAIISITLAVYQFAPYAQFMPVDDASLSYGNPIVKNFDVKGAFSSYDPELYIPLTLLSYQIEYLFFGSDPTGYHVTNVVLHMFNALLVLFLVRFWTVRWEIPFLTALLFAVHPINTEAVMWVSGRKDLLSVLFMLSSLLAYCAHRVSGKSRFYYTSLVLFLLGLLSKVLVVTLPLLLIITDDLIPAPKRPNERLSKWAFYIPAFVFLWIAMIRKFISVYSITYGQSILIAGKSVAFYLQQLLFPMHLSMFYKQNTPIELARLEFVLPLIALLILALIILESKRFGKTFAFGMMWFGITVLPNLANASKGGKPEIFYATDRYVYVSSIGIFFLMSWGLSYLLSRYGGIRKYTTAFLIVVIISAYGWQANRYSIHWLVPDVYMRHVLAHYPETPVAHTVVGLKELEDDKTASAIEHFKKSLQQSPTFKVARAHLGLALMKTGKTEEGLAEIQKLKEMAPEHEYVYTYLAFGHILLDEDNIAQGLLMQVLSQLPRDSKALQLMGTLAAKKGDNGAARMYYEKSIAADPSDVRSKAALVRLLQSQI